MILGDNTYTYYVSSSTSTNCPQPCHPLSYYINNTATYFTSNATFIFMEGEHLLDSNKGLVQIAIDHVDNLTLRGERGHSNTDIIIRCSSNTRGLAFRYGNIINICDITITGCGQPYIPSILLANINSLYIHHVILHNNEYNTSNYDAGGILYIHCTLITITESIFANNLIGSQDGGVYIKTVANTQITIDNSTFAGNIVGKYGGGLFVDATFNTSSILSITNSIFTNHTVGDGGGALHVYTTYYLYININIINSTFSGNIIDGMGGGLFIMTNAYTKSIITITNSTFTNSTVDDSGAALLIQGGSTSIYNIVTIINSVFTSNYGGGLYLSSGSIWRDDLTIIDTTFTNNTKYGLYIYFTAYSTVTFTRIMVHNNSGSGIVAWINATLVFTGHSIVANNSSPTDGGGIYLGKNCFLTTSNGGHVSFINNTARRYGGAIYSPHNDHPSLRYNLGVYILHSEHCSIYNLSATFINNSAAKAGDLVYGGVYIHCQGVVFDILKSIIQCPNVPYTIKNAPSVHPLSPIASDPLIVCLCFNNTINCTTTSIDRVIYPGQILKVSLATVGLCGKASPGSVVVEYDTQITLTSSATTDYTSNSCNQLNYVVKLTSHISNATITLGAAESAIYNLRPINVHLSILPCPLGMVVNFTSGDCVCNIILTSQVICNISWMPYPIQRSDNNWISHLYNNYNCTVAHTGCPFDYCKTQDVKISLDEPDLQCNYNRSGILCGQCQPGLSLMIGSNRCTNCTDTTLIAISIVIISAVAGIVLVALLLLLNLTVSVGSINGLLFYANLVKLNESVFFSQGNIPVISQFISWCNLDIGFEYCFVDGLDGYVKTWLQFVFPVYVWVLVIVIIVACRYSSRLTRLCGRNAVPVLATLILMSYTKLSRAVTNALMMNTLQCGEYKWNVWNVDGNVRYLSGKHIVLVTVSLLFLITGLVYTGLVFCSQWLQRYSGKCCKSTRDPVVRLKPLIDAYTGPFKDKYRFWTGLCLIVRLKLTVAFSFTTIVQSKLNNYIIQLIVIGMMTILIVGERVYKEKCLTILETASFINLLCLSIMTILFAESYWNVSTDVIVSVSVSIEMLLFVIIVIVHCYVAFNAFFNLKLLFKSRSPVLSAIDIDELPFIIDDRQEFPVHKKN